VGDASLGVMVWRMLGAMPLRLLEQVMPTGVLIFV
jgi:hypothetical protein